MYSCPDTLAGGFPHSEICGSTIARISPQLIAACHVLHRLLAPRHPPNALNSLETNSIARTQYQTAPKRRPGRAKLAASTQTQLTTLLYATSTKSLIYLSMNMPAGRPKGRASGGLDQAQQPERHAANGHATRFRGISAARPRKWRRSGSNRRPPACKAGALPAELRPHTSRTNPVTGRHQRQTPATAEPQPTRRLPPGDFYLSPQRQAKMGQGGLEPPTPRLSSVCSNQLSYWPPSLRHKPRSPEGPPAPAQGQNSTRPTA